LPSSLNDACFRKKAFREFSNMSNIISFSEEIIGTEMCPKNDFSCGDGRCIRFEWRYDSVEDCLNGADEQNCSKTYLPMPLFVSFVFLWM
jgi:hypothetical protein